MENLLNVNIFKSLLVCRRYVWYDVAARLAEVNYLNLSIHEIT